MFAIICLFIYFDVLITSLLLRFYVACWLGAPERANDGSTVDLSGATVLHKLVKREYGKLKNVKVDDALLRSLVLIKGKVEQALFCWSTINHAAPEIFFGQDNKILPVKMGLGFSSCESEHPNTHDNTSLQTYCKTIIFAFQLSGRVQSTTP